MNATEVWMNELDGDLRPRRRRQPPLDGQERPLRALASARTPLEAYERGCRFVEAGSLEPLERQVTLLAAARACGSSECLTSHFAMALRTGLDRDLARRLRAGQQLTDERLEALRGFTEAAVLDPAFLDTAVEPFLGAGFERTQVIDVVVAARALCAFVQHLAKRRRGVA